MRVSQSDLLINVTNNKKTEETISRCFKQNWTSGTSDTSDGFLLVDGQNFRSFRTEVATFPGELLS